MPLLTINHKTIYRYTRPVAFGEHRIMLRPRDGHDLRVLDSLYLGAADALLGMDVDIKVVSVGENAEQETA